MRILLTLLVFVLQACDWSAYSTAMPNRIAEEKSTEPKPAVSAGIDRQVLFGDLHVHTMYSFDAFIFGTTASPDMAY